MDCERASSNDGILDARRNKLAMSLLEYELHGKFKFTEEGRAFPDTYFFTIQQMHEGGMSKADIGRIMTKHEKAMAAANEMALDELPDDEPESPRVQTP